MPKLGDSLELISKAIVKFGLPEWVSKYVDSYIGNDATNAKRLLSFANPGRKKGSIAGNKITMPNGVVFDISFIAEVLRLFYYGEMRVSSIYQKWAGQGYGIGNEAIYKEKTAEYAMLAEKHAKAIKSIMDGLHIKNMEESAEVFDYLDGIREWDKRIVAIGIIMKDSYAYAFGATFYRAFYRVMPEFMRAFGKVLSSDKELLDWFSNEAKRIVSESRSEELKEFALTLLAYVSKSIENELGLAKENGIEREAKLLGSIAIAAPLHELSELGMELDIENEFRHITKGAFDF